jgi:hypothetical protein
VVALSATALILIIMAGIKPVERRLFTDRRQQTITLLIDRQDASLLAVEAAIEETGLRPQHTMIQRDEVLVQFSKEGILSLFQLLLTRQALLPIPAGS